MIFLRYLTPLKITGALKTMTTKAIRLEDKAVYDPATHSVYKIGDVENQVSLAIPASLCLHNLLQKKGEVVSHADLLAFAWTSRGIMVSPNTLYQNMSVLRKALVSLGVSPEIIKTVPKRGFVIPSGFPVEFIDDAEDNTAPQVLPDVAVIMGSPEEVPPLPLSPDRNKTPTLRNSLFILAACLTFYISYLISNYVGDDAIPQYIAPEFVKIDNIQDCQVFRNTSLRENAFFTQFISDKKVECGREKWWYLTNYPPSRQVSLLRCSRALSDTLTEKTSLCISDFYSEGGQ